MAVRPILVIMAALALLGGCVGDGQPWRPDPASRGAELIVEGNLASFPAFEAAAKACGYTNYWRFPGAKITETYTAPPHFNLFRTSRPDAQCVIKWVVDYPQTGLLLRGE